MFHHQEYGCIYRYGVVCFGCISKISLVGRRRRRRRKRKKKRKKKKKKRVENINQRTNRDKRLPRWSTHFMWKSVVPCGNVKGKKPKIPQYLSSAVSDAIFQSLKRSTGWHSQADFWGVKWPCNERWGYVEMVTVVQRRQEIVRWHVADHTGTLFEELKRKLPSILRTVAT